MTLKGFIRNIVAWNHAPSKTIGGAALLIAIAGIASRILGFLRDRLLAAEFGAGDVLDAYYAAFRLPDLFYSFIVLGALSAAFIPVFTELMTKKHEREAWKLATGVLHLMFYSLGSLAILGIIFAPWLTQWLAPGFMGEKQEAVTTLTRIMLLSPLLLSVSAVFGGVLISFKQFAAYSFAPVLYNLGIICGVVFFVPVLGSAGLGWGVVLGSLLHMLVQYPTLRRSGFRYRFVSFGVWRDKTVQRVMKLMVPRSLGMAVNQLSLLVMTVFASLLASGSLAIFTLANNIQSVPLGLFGIAFSLAAFPSLSLFIAEKKERDFFKTLAETTRRILFFVVPLSVFMIIFRAQVVRVILGTGQFDWEDTILTFEVLKFLAISLFAQSLIPLFARAFFAMQDTRTPLYIALASEALHVALIPILLPYYQVEGLAIAFSASSVLNFFLLYYFLRKNLSVWKDSAMLIPVGKILLASFFAGAVAQVSKSVFALTTNELDTFIEVFLQLLTGLAIGGVSFLFMSSWLKLEDFESLKRYILCKVLRQPEKVALTEDHPERIVSSE